MDPKLVDRVKPWWQCPNDPPCLHGGVFHDVEDFNDPTPTCCVEGCTCGSETR